MPDNSGARAIVAITIQHETDGISSWVAYVLTFDDGQRLTLAGHSPELDAAHERLMLGEGEPVTVTFPLTIHYNPTGGRHGF